MRSAGRFTSNQFLLILPFIGEDSPELDTFHGMAADRWDFFPVESFARVVKYTRWLPFIPCAIGSKYRVEGATGLVHRRDQGAERTGAQPRVRGPIDVVPDQHVRLDRGSVIV